jgi:hypothetical protein
VTRRQSEHRGGQSNNLGVLFHFLLPNLRLTDVHGCGAKSANEPVWKYRQVQTELQLSCPTVIVARRSRFARLASVLERKSTM